MTPSVLSHAPRRILCIAVALVFAAHSARAAAPQPAPYGLHQSPIHIATPCPIRAPKFGDTSARANETDADIEGHHRQNVARRMRRIRPSSALGQPESLAARHFQDTDPIRRFTYTLLEFHFHSPAEHLVNGRLTEMEAHYVFKKDLCPTCGPTRCWSSVRRSRRAKRTPCWTRSSAASHCRLLSQPARRNPRLQNRDVINYTARIPTGIRAL